MKLFAPIQIQESKDGGYAGGSPILPAGDYQGTSRMEVAEQLYSSLCRTIQSSKSRELVNTIEEHEAKEEFDYIQVDFFSRREHFLLCFLWFILILALFTGLYTLGSFIYYQFHTQFYTCKFSSKNLLFLAFYSWSFFCAPSPPPKQNKQLKVTLCTYTMQRMNM